MKRFALLAVVAISSAASGCASCCAPYDYAYPTYGGKWERVDRFHGRVASAFNDASGVYSADGATYIDGEGEIVDEAIVDE